MKLFHGQGEFCLHMDMGLSPGCYALIKYKVLWGARELLKDEVKGDKNTKSLGWKKGIILLDEINVFFLEITLWMRTDG